MTRRDYTNAEGYICPTENSAVRGKEKEMIDLDRQKENFKNHVATFTDYGNIKILDFKKPNSGEYRIRFLFEEDYCRLHISGDLGELTATNYNNMTYGKFSGFVNNTGYFEEKIDCHSRPLYFFDAELAKRHLLEIIEERELEESLMQCDHWYETLDEAVDDIISDFYYERGISDRGYEILSEIDGDAFEYVGSIGKERSGILELYMLAFKLATEQLKETRHAE